MLPCGEWENFHMHMRSTTPKVPIFLIIDPSKMSIYNLYCHGNPSKVGVCFDPYYLLFLGAEEEASHFACVLFGLGPGVLHRSF